MWREKQLEIKGEVNELSEIWNFCRIGDVVNYIEMAVFGEKIWKGNQDKHGRQFNYNVRGSLWADVKFTI